MISLKATLIAVLTAFAVGIIGSLALRPVGAGTGISNGLNVNDTEVRIH